MLRQHLEASGAAAGTEHLVVIAPQRALQGCQDIRFVVDQQQALNGLVDGRLSLLWQA